MMVKADGWLGAGAITLIVRANLGYQCDSCKLGALGKLW